MELTISQFIDQAAPVPVELTINCNTKNYKKMRKCMGDYCKLNHIKIEYTIEMEESTPHVFAIYSTYTIREGYDYTDIIREDRKCQTDLGLFVKYLGNAGVINSAKANEIAQAMRKMRGPEKCTIPGCKGSHTTTQHRCSECKKIGVDHIGEDCPENCNVCFVCHQIGVTHREHNCPERCCTIPGCNGSHSTRQHRCSACKKIGSDHIAKDCPEKCDE